MRIGFDGGCLANRRGFGRFARQVLNALAAGGCPHEIVVLLDRPSAEAVDLPQGVRTTLVDVREAPSRAASAQGRRRVGDMLAMSRAVARAGLDLVYFPATYSFFPVWGVPRVVVTMHDTLALAHPELVFTSWKGRAAWALKEHAAVRWADRILTVSETSRADLLSWFRLPSDRVRVMSEGAERVFRPVEGGPESDRVLSRHGVRPGSRYFLYVGGLSPHKNLPRLIEAFARVADDVALVLVGDVNDVFLTQVPALRAAVEAHGLGDRVRFTGYVPDEELVFLYSRAYALVQPSLMEGFGLPPVEAMACGTPVLYSRAGSLPEVVGDAGLAFDPRDVGRMAEALNAILADGELRRRLARRAVERAACYSWEAAARTLVEVFEELDPRRSRGKSA